MLVQSSHRPTATVVIVGFPNGRIPLRSRRQFLPVRYQGNGVEPIGTSGNLIQSFESEASISGKDTAACSLGWGTATIGTAGFGAVAYDVFDTDSLHVLQPLDDSLHMLAQSLDPVISEWVFRQCISNSMIYVGKRAGQSQTTMGECTFRAIHINICQWL